MPTATHDPKRRALGKGLESLLPSRPAVVPQIVATAVESNGKPLDIPLDNIERNPFQTRTRFDEVQLNELAQSIAATGVVQPILVRPLGVPNRYQLIAGERRWLASRKAGKSTIPAIVRQVSDEQTLEMTIVENLQRADLNPMEQARAYQRLSQQFHLTQEQMATRTGKERASVANFLRLLRLPEPVQQKVESGELTFGHARTLLGLESAESITSAAQKVMALSLSVRQTETYVQGLINPETKQKKEDKPKPEVDPNVREAQDRLRRNLGLKVQIEDKKGKGRVIIEYSGLEDFDAILTALGGDTES
jgi:ParB family chromosome partitioning protein